jgi:tRNA (guanine37-N1)-methyltransferase
VHKLLYKAVPVTENVDDILTSVLPPLEDVPSGFTSTGHIGTLRSIVNLALADSSGHMNLRDEWLPYKSLIGQVILDVSCMSRG